MAKAMMSKPEGLTNPAWLKGRKSGIERGSLLTHPCITGRKQKKRRDQSLSACFFNKASICHFGKIWRMGVCLPKQFRLFPPKRRPLVQQTSNTEKQLASSRLSAFFAYFSAVCRNKGRINEKIQTVL